MVDLTLAQLKRLVKKYDELMSIPIKGMKLPELLKAIDKAGYKVNHEEKRLDLKAKQKVKKLPRKIKLPEAPVKKPVDKAGALAKKKEMVIKLFLKHPTMHKEIMDDERMKDI